MKFTIPRLNVVESDNGFSVEVLSPSEIRYSEAGNVWEMSSELLADDTTALVIYRDTIRLVSAVTTGESLSSAHRDAIVSNIQKAFRFRGIEIQVM